MKLGALKKTLNFLSEKGFSDDTIVVCARGKDVFSMSTLEGDPEGLVPHLIFHLTESEDEHNALVEKTNKKKKNSTVYSQMEDIMGFKKL